MKSKIISLILFGSSFFYLLSSLRYKMGTYKNMGPGFFPLIIGILLLLLTGFHLFRVFGKEHPEEKAEDTLLNSKKNYLAVIGIIVSTTAYPFILEYAKFILSTFLVGFAMLLLLKPKSPASSFFISLIIAVGCFLLFSRLFGVALPMGPVEEFMFRLGG